MIENATWIKENSDNGISCVEFYRKIPAGNKQRAVLTVTAAGVYEAYIGGKKVSDFVLAPGCCSYSHRLQYQTYELLDMPKEECELCIRTAPGWYRGHISRKSEQFNTSPAAVIAELVIEYSDGTIQHIYTDKSWKVRSSKVIESDLYDGETYDACAEEKLLGDAAAADISKDILIPQEGEKICEHEHIYPQRILKTPKGETVIDFGQNFAGYVQISVNAHAHDRIVLSHAEILDGDGNFYTENYRKAKAKLIYICKEGEQQYKPHFAFYGFRYIRIDEFPGEPEVYNFTGIALYSDIKRTGWISCGHAGINRLVENVLWSQRSNFIDIPTDCPQRDERMGWLGDAQVFAETAAFNYNVSRFFKKWMGDVRADQREDGSVPDVVPNYWLMKRASTGWGDAVAIVPWRMYLMYGDKSFLEDNFEAIRAWVDYITNDTKDKYLWTSSAEEKKLWGKHYGDWLALDAPYGSYMGSTDEDRIASAFYAYSTQILVKAGKAAGRDVSSYEKLYENIVKAYKSRYTDETTQTDCVLALHFNLTDHPEETADKLAEMIRENDNKLKTGFIGTPYLLHALSRYGYAELAYTLLLQDKNPSWLYEVNHGATTIWEHWDGIRDDNTIWSSDMNSYNHYAYGSVLDWIYTVAAGIKTDEQKPGFAAVTIAPVPDRRLGWLNVRVKTVNGEIRSSWAYENSRIRYEIETPSDTDICIAGRKYHVGKGSYIFYSEG